MRLLLLKSHAHAQTDNVDRNWIYELIRADLNTPEDMCDL